MTSIWHDYSQHSDLAPIARVVADLAAVAGKSWHNTVIVGAFARDLHLYYRFGIDITRKTEDIDFAFAASDWEGFGQLRDDLIKSGDFAGVPKMVHRLRHSNDLQIDIVPFGGVETPDRKLHWPEPDDTVMDVYGAHEAMSSAHQIALPLNVSARLVSYPALVVLKLVTWNDRHRREPGKDGNDIGLLLRSYLDAGQQERLWEEFASWLEEEDFDYQEAGARMLGVDIRRVLDEPGRERVLEILETQCSEEVPGVLPNEMGAEDRSRQLLGAMFRGLSEGAV